MNGAGAAFAGLLMAITLAASSARADSGDEIVGPLPNVAPKQSAVHEPTALDLIDTWLGGYDWPKGKRFDQERYQILKRDVSWKETGRATMMFRLLPLQGSAEQLAAQRCPGRANPIEIQIYYEWSDYIHTWVATQNRGDPGFEACPDKATFWTDEQLAKLVNPPPLPIPPVVTAKDVITPAPGSAEREALLDAVRPIYETMFGKPIAFEVQTMKVAAGFAFMTVHPERRRGAPIEQGQWKKLGQDCWQTPKSVMHEFWMKKVNGAWQVALRNNFCADNSIMSEGDIVGAPPQLVGQTKWDARTAYPVDAITTGIAE